ncbi:MAG: hypothetical protein ACJAXU_000237, partial [Paracoccaceae bacterium]
MPKHVSCSSYSAAAFFDLQGGLAREVLAHLQMASLCRLSRS